MQLVYQTCEFAFHVDEEYSVCKQPIDQRCSSEKAFRKYKANLRENTHAEV